jgi:gliding motility-associated-like protein
MDKFLKIGFFVNVLLISVFPFFGKAQAPIYDDCTKAYELCPNTPAIVNNINATKLQFPGSPDVFPATFCFTANNTIWLKFYTNEDGGFGQIAFSNLVFENEIGQDNQIQATILEAGAPCDASTYTQIGNCESGTSSNFSLSANFLPLKTYYVVLNGDFSGVGITKAAEFTVEAFLTGPGVLRPTPIITIQADKDTICRDEIVTFTTSLQQCPDSTVYSWFINNVLVGKTIDTIFQTSAVTKGAVITVSNACYQNCTVYPEASINTIEVIEFPVSAGEDKELIFGESVVLDGFTTVQNFVWSPTSFLVGKNYLNPTVNPPESTSYFLTADSLGCKFTDEVFVKVSLDLVITNTFTPNADGSNDKWEIPGLVNFPNCLIEVYDRWGQLVYEATGYNEEKAWDGKKSGKALAESVYYYVIHLRNSNETQLRGTITLMR